MEMMIALTIMGILLSFTLKVPSSVLKSSQREAPVILMGCLNEELRNSMEFRINTQVIVQKGEIAQVVDRKIKKRVVIDGELTIEYVNMKEERLTFGMNTDFTFRINGESNRSGRINFRRNQKVEGYLMIHFGSSTMDLRGY